MSFSSAGDVWSFGVYLWELWSVGSTPWLTYRSPKLLFQTIEAGHRLAAPADCPERIVLLMQSCWELDMRARPHIADLQQRLLQGIVSVYHTDAGSVLLLEPSALA